MNTKFTLQRYFGIVLIAFLAACASTPAEKSTPTVTSSPASATPSGTPEVVGTLIPSPLPLTPTVPVIMPDAMQVQRWKEYQSALAKSFSFSQSELPLCDWDILGQSDQKIYVWAVCAGLRGSGVSAPAVIHLGADGSIQKVENPRHWDSDIPRMFPIDIQAKFAYYNFGRAGVLSAHIARRRTHPEEPPLIVLSATPTP